MTSTLDTQSSLLQNKLTDGQLDYIGNEFDIPPGLIYLCQGYDVFGEYESTKSFTHPLINWNKLDNTNDWHTVNIDGKIYNIPKLVDSFPSEDLDIRQESGYQAESYMHSLGISASLEGNYSYFSGSLKTEFSKSKNQNSSTFFSRVHQNINIQEFKLKPDQTKLRDILDESFSASLNKDKLSQEDANKLFKTYGTHFVTGLTLGGRLTYATATEMTSSTEITEAAATARLSYSSIIGSASAQFSADMKNKISKFQQHSETYFVTQGGNAVLAAKAKKDQDFQPWYDSIRDNPEFSGFTFKDSLRGIWTLCNNDLKRKRLLEYYINYAESQTVRNESFDLDYAVSSRRSYLGDAMNDAIALAKGKFLPKFSLLCCGTHSDRYIAAVFYTKAQIETPTLLPQADTIWKRVRVKETDVDKGTPGKNSVEKLCKKVKIELEKLKLTSNQFVYTSIDFAINATERNTAYCEIVYPEMK